MRLPRFARNDILSCHCEAGFASRSNLGGGNRACHAPASRGQLQEFAVVEAKDTGKANISGKPLDRLPRRWYITEKRSSL